MRLWAARSIAVAAWVALWALSIIGARGAGRHGNLGDLVTDTVGAAGIVTVAAICGYQERAWSQFFVTFVPGYGILNSFRCFWRAAGRTVDRPPALDHRSADSSRPSAGRRGRPPG